MGSDRLEDGEGEGVEGGGGEILGKLGAGGEGDGGGKARKDDGGLRGISGGKEGRELVVYGSVGCGDGARVGDVGAEGCAEGVGDVLCVFGDHGIILEERGDLWGGRDGSGLCGHCGPGRGATPVLPRGGATCFNMLQNPS